MKHDRKKIKIWSLKKVKFKLKQHFHCYKLLNKHFHQLQIPNKPSEYEYDEGQIQMIQSVWTLERLKMSDVTQTNNLCIPINPNINFSSIQPIAIHGPTDTLCGFGVVEANHTAALGLAVLHLNISILDHACREMSADVRSPLNVK